jgi:hypothetical protein
LDRNPLRAHVRPPAPATASGKKELAGLSFCHLEVLINYVARLVGQFEANRPPSLLLPDRSSTQGVSIRGHIIHADSDDIAATQLAIDREIEQGQVARAALKLEFGPDRQTWLGRSGGFGPINFPLFQG